MTPIQAVDHHDHSPEPSDQNPPVLLSETASAPQAQSFFFSVLKEIRLQLKQQRPQNEILAWLIHAAEAHSPGLIASLLMRNGDKLFNACETRLPDVFSKAIDGVTIGDEVGACGTAAFRGTPFYIGNTLEHPYTAVVRDLFKQINLRACWSHPIISADGETLGTFAFYRQATGLPTLEESEMLGYVSDIAALVIESKKNQAALTLSENRFQMALSATQAVGIWDWDIPNNKVFADANFAKIFGVDPALGEQGEAIEAFFSGIHPDDLERVSGIINQLTQTGGPFLEEYRLKAQQGQKSRWVLARGECYLDNCKAVRFPGVALDITEHKERALRDSAMHELSNALRGLDDLAYIAGAGAEILGKTFNVMRAGYGTVNDAQDTIVIEKDWVSGPDITSLAGTYYFPDFGSFIEDLKRGETVCLNDVDHDDRVVSESFKALNIRALINLPVLENGKLVAVLFLQDAVPRTWSQEEIDFLLLVADRTRSVMERVRTTQELRTLNETLEQRVQERTEELTAVNNELESFSYSVSHDLRAPLRGLSGFSNALLTQYADQLDAEGQDYLQFIQKNADRMGDLIDGLLKLSRINRMPILQQRLNISQTASDLLSEATRQEADRPIQYAVQPNLFAEGDLTLLRQLLQNLVENAIKYSSKKPVSSIEFGQGEFEGRFGKKTAYFIKDNGAGFNMAYYDKLFGAFQRLHTEEDYPGTGIGLATVQRIVHRLNGHVWAESVQGEGSTFYFTLNEQETAQP